MGDHIIDFLVDGQVGNVAPRVPLDDQLAVVDLELGSEVREGQVLDKGSGERVQVFEGGFEESALHILVDD